MTPRAGVQHRETVAHVRRTEDVAGDGRGGEGADTGERDGIRVAELDGAALACERQVCGVNRDRAGGADAAPGLQGQVGDREDAAAGRVDHTSLRLQDQRVEAGVAC